MTVLTQTMPGQKLMAGQTKVSWPVSLASSCVVDCQSGQLRVGQILECHAVDSQAGVRGGGEDGGGGHDGLGEVNRVVWERGGGCRW